MAFGCSAIREEQDINRQKKAKKKPLLSDSHKILDQTNFISFGIFLEGSSVI